MQLPKSCLDCGKIIPAGSRCPEHRRLQRSLWSDDSALRRRERVRGFGAARRMRYRINKEEWVTCSECRSDFLPSQVHVDHIDPLATGGLDVDENLRILCIPCHKARPYPTP